MRVTVCELPHESKAFASAWSALCRHTVASASQLVLLPELASLEPVWESERFDAHRWNAIESLSEVQMRRLPELGAEYVAGTRPVRVNGRRLNQAYLWSAASGVRPLRSKYFMPEEPGNWEASWFQKGDPRFPIFRAGPLSIGVNICTELWALETYSAYAERDVNLLLSPRATESATFSKWHSAGVVASVRSGAFSLSSNRVDANGAYGGIGWIIDPAGRTLAVTSALEPFVTCDVDLDQAAESKHSYPRYVFSGSSA